MDEIQAAERFLWQEFKRRRAAQDAVAALNYEPGQLVRSVNDSRRLPKGAVGKIDRIGPKNLVVDFGVYRAWRIPPSLVEPAPEGAKVLQHDEDEFVPFARRRGRRVGV